MIWLEVNFDTMKYKPMNKIDTTTTASAQPENVSTKETALLPIRLQDINRINSYLLYCGMKCTQSNIAMQHCKEILAQFKTPKIRKIYNALDKAIGF